MDRLVKLFKEAKEDSSWVKLPVVNYLRACPLPEAKVHLEELAKLDPEVVKRAMNYYPTAPGTEPTPPEGVAKPETPAAPTTPAPSNP